MKTIIIALLTLTSTILTAQNTVIWLGGTPGNETNWNVAKNWSDNRVPDENSIVIIKRLNTGHDAQPDINKNVEVASIEIQSNAFLTINESGELSIDGEYIYTEGISIYGGKLVNNGAIHLSNLAVQVLAEDLNTIQNTGQIFVNNQLRKGQEELIDNNAVLVHRN